MSVERLRPKLEGISIEYLKEMLLALVDLKLKYQGKSGVSQYRALMSNAISSCPLCRLTAFDKHPKLPSLEVCSKCPWVIFRNKICMNSYYQDTEISSRLKRIYLWIKTIEKELECRSQV